MLRMRLQRVGRKHEPYYRLVVAQKQAPVKGKFVTSIGSYNPAKALVDIDEKRVMDWLNKGVTPSNRVARLLTKLGVKHKLVVVKTFKAKSTQELEAERKEDQVKKAAEAAEKEKAKAEFEAKQQEEASEKPEEKPDKQATES
ncbi:30S ribosomal protein S16 [Candidatus Berkelbacteria bacterium]|nr:30S ribosomal protein S16 [Candidatus Berkelbacteria bacterium]